MSLYVLHLWWKHCYEYKAFIFIWLFYSVITHPFVELKIKEYVTICMLWWSTKEDERIGIEWTFIKSSILIESLIDAFCDKRPAHHFACKEMKAFGSNLMIRLSIRLLVVMHIMVLFYFMYENLVFWWHLYSYNLILLNIQLYIFVISYFKNQKECS